MGVLCLKKSDLKSLVTQMYEDLLSSIDEQEYANKDDVVHYLQDAVNTISSIDTESIDSLEHAKAAFTNTFKEIAKKSLSEYSDTNGRFQELTQEHQKTINQCNDVHIDLSSVTHKFNEIQDHMTQEVGRANQVITDLSNKIQALERSSNLDSLTRVLNRRALTTYLQKLCQREKIKDELHLLILDIDDFKVINDTYGHIAGDKILIFIANILRKTLRDGDKVFRYGGEEFIIILNRIEPTACYEISNRILNIISSNQLIYKGESLKVTMSIGATKFYTGDTPDALIHRADTALYKSKKAGKNQMNSELKPDGN